MAIISVNELVTTCQKIAEVFGYGWGSNTDIAELICWLELNGFNGLQRFRHIIDTDALTQHQSVQYEKTSNSLNIDAMQQSAIVFALTSLDFAKALVDQQAQTSTQPVQINYSNVTDAIVLLAAAASIDFECPVRLAGTDAGKRFVALISTDTVEMTASDDNATSTAANDETTLDALTVTVPGRRDEDCGDSRNLQGKFSFNHRQRRLTALTEGVSVDPELWQSLLQESKRILVPASEHSRQFGTGGGNANE